MNHLTKASAPSALRSRAAAGSPAGNAGAVGVAWVGAAEDKGVRIATVVVAAGGLLVADLVLTGVAGPSGPGAEHAASGASAVSATRAAAYLLGGGLGQVLAVRICVP